MEALKDFPSNVRLPMDIQTRSIHIFSEAFWLYTSQ